RSVLFAQPLARNLRQRESGCRCHLRWGEGVMTRAPTTLPLDSIRVGKRIRRDLGDIDALAASIAEVGLLQPIAVTFDGHLIAGERRLRAVRLLGWKTIPYTPIPINLDQIVRGEFAENACRKDFTLSEAVAIKR